MDALTNDVEYLESEQFASKTYKLNLDTGRIIGAIDGFEAVYQAVVKILSTERYAYLIYSSRYGVELDDLIGQDSNYIKSDLERRLSEALLVDDRISGISDFKILSGEDIDSMIINFTVLTAEQQQIPLQWRL